VEAFSEITTGSGDISEQSIQVWISTLLLSPMHLVDQ